ncbi:hypothetical protein KL86SPO_70024 [uncultured Sporomusa sp.]|uniref:Uncharacterized protein n=1 Tax=uncultured Sporomusa sp. TaxID=307249 RepID=A0A212M078_9FIRM|nr:hypothetical protein [uncultured Sporomusa sp.]SCM83166.1 hypothetical protein KL86SPO_70024 [uncultured Sporomusa sp.]
MQKPGISRTVIKPEHGRSSQRPNKGGILANKHLAAMARAEDLLHTSEAPDRTVADDWNCGKLTRFIRYIRNGIIGR